MRYLLFIITLITLSIACRKEPISRDSSDKLSFSADTVLFDTVFTTIGSTTQWIQVHNRSKKKIIVSSIRLGNTNSFYRINVDGLAGTEFRDVEIAAKDSIFIFVEVTVDPRNTNNPFIALDSIVFETNGNIQDVKLVAWGQDAHFHTSIAGTSFSPIRFQNEVWTNDKPHVVYGYFFIDSTTTLTIEKGTKVYMHGNSGMLVYAGGSLRIKGTASEPVIIQGDRLEAAYREEPGQWDRIWLYPGSINNTIDYAIIKNGNVGVQVDTVGNSGYTLKISNTKIEHMAGAAIYAQGAKIDAYNCVFADCGIHSVLLSIGGDYRFRNCTFANYWNQGGRDTPLLGMSNYYEASNGSVQLRPLVQAYFGNCILYGNLSKEIGFDSKPGAAFDYMFDHCVVKADTSFDNQMLAYPQKFSNVIRDTVLFLNVNSGFYELRDGSKGIDQGSSDIINLNPSFSFDLKGNSRWIGAAPDMGAYEK